LKTIFTLTLFLLCAATSTFAAGGVRINGDLSLTKETGDPHRVLYFSDNSSQQFASPWSFNNLFPKSIYYNDSGGKVGIGTTTPTSELDVMGDAHVSASVKLGDPFSTSLTSSATVARDISLPDVSGRVITTGNLGDITTLGSSDSSLKIGGSIQIGADSSICSASKRGSIRYTGDALEVCDGSSWSTLTALQRPAIWSGGCSTHGTTVGWNTYCLDSTEFNTASAFFTANSNGTVSFLKSGYYRFNAYFASLTNGVQQTRFQKNGVPFFSSIDYQTGAWNDKFADIIYQFNAGDIFIMDSYIQSTGYAFHSYAPTGNFSRLQIMFIGPL